MTRQALLALALTLCMTQGACSSLVATVEPTPEDLIEAQKGVTARDEAIEVVSTEHFRDGKGAVMSMALRVNIASIPDGANVRSSYLRLRLAQAVVLRENGLPAFTWKPRLHIMRQGLDSLTKDEEGRVTGEVTRDSTQIQCVVSGAGVPLLLSPSLQLEGFEGADRDPRYLDVLSYWNPAEKTRVKVNAYWLELDMGTLIQKSLEDDELLIWLEGPVTWGGDKDAQERYHDDQAQPGYLRPHLHVEYQY